MEKCMQRLSLEISVAFIHVKRCIVLTLWQTLQMYVNTLERGKKNLILWDSVLMNSDMSFYYSAFKTLNIWPKKYANSTSACRYSGLKVNDVIGFNKDIKTINPPPKSATNKTKSSQSKQKEHLFGNFILFLYISTIKTANLQFKPWFWV